MSSAIAAWPGQNCIMTREIYFSSFYNSLFFLALRLGGHLAARHQPITKSGSMYDGQVSPRIESQTVSQRSSSLYFVPEVVLLRLRQKGTGTCAPSFSSGRTSTTTQDRLAPERQCRKRQLPPGIGLRTGNVRTPALSPAPRRELRLPTTTSQTVPVSRCPPQNPSFR